MSKIDCNKEIDFGNFASRNKFGSTMHEHYDNLGLINMNGRLYDPLIGRMLPHTYY